MTADRATTKAPDPVLDVRDLSVRFRMRGGRDIAAVTGARFSVAPGSASPWSARRLRQVRPGLRPARPAARQRGHHRKRGARRRHGPAHRRERTLARTVRGRRIGLVPQSPAAHLTPVRTVRAQLEESLRELTGSAAERAAEVRRGGRRPRLVPRGPPRPLPARALRRTRPARRDRPRPDRRRPAAARRRTDHRTRPGPRRADRRRTAPPHRRGPGPADHHPRPGRRRTHRRPGRRDVRGPDRRDRGAEAFFGAPGPRHPYAKGLLDALPEREFTPIPGMPPELGALPDGCAFADRCAYADARCTGERPVFTAGLACHHGPTGRAPSPTKESADA